MDNKNDVAATEKSTVHLQDDLKITTARELQDELIVCICQTQGSAEPLFDLYCLYTEDLGDIERDSGSKATVRLAKTAIAIRRYTKAMRMNIGRLETILRKTEDYLNEYR